MIIDEWIQGGVMIYTDASRESQLANVGPEHYEQWFELCYVIWENPDKVGGKSCQRERKLGRENAITRCASGKVTLKFTL